SVTCDVARRDEGAADAAGRSSATTALTKFVSGLARSASSAFRQVKSRERDSPYRRAIAATKRGSDMLSKTIRAFSSSDQRRRRPVSTTSSRFSAMIVSLSIRTVLNHQVSPPQGGSPRRLTPFARSVHKRRGKPDRCRGTAIPAPHRGALKLSTSMRCMHDDHRALMAVLKRSKHYGRD